MIAMANASYLQQRFGINLKTETTAIVKERMFNWILNGGGKFERHVVKKNFELFDWLSYSAVPLLLKFN